MMYQPELQAKETPGLEDYLSAIRRRFPLVLIAGLLGFALMTFVTLSRTDQYVAESRVLVNPTPVGSTDGRLVSPVLEREREVIVSNAIAERAAESLGIGQSGRSLLTDLEVVFVDDSDSLELRYQSSEPETAANVVNAFAEEYVELRIEQANALDQATISELQAEVDEIDAEVAELEAQIAAISAERSQLIASAAAAGTFADTTAFNDQITSLRTTINAALVDRRSPVTDLADAQLEQSTRNVPAEVLQFSSVPDTPSGLSSNILRAVGLVFGLGLGVALAFVLQRLDRTARESGDVELALGSTVLGSVPPFGFRNSLSKAGVIMLGNSRSPKVQRARESFRRLRSSLQFLRSSRETKTILVTSAVPGEGKSTASTNIAVALAQGGASVCLVNADMRRPTIERLLGVASGTGLSNWLDDPSVSNIMVAVPNVSGLVLIPSGPSPLSPGELLASGNLPELFNELSDQFDFVIIDAPPLLSAADAAAISPHVDGTVIVVDTSRTGTDDLLSVRSQLERSGGTILGAILNKDSQDSGLRLRKDRYAYEKVSAARADA